jgi:hypothetical protein
MEQVMVMELQEDFQVMVVHIPLPHQEKLLKNLGQ